MKKVLMMAAVCLMAAMTFAAQCAATTKKGTQCKRQASPGSEFCWQHGGTTKAERAGNGESEAPKRKARRTESSEDGNGGHAGRVTLPKGGESVAPAANDTENREIGSDLDISDPTQDDGDATERQCD